LELIEIDGSLGEGGGQILRTSLSLSTLLNKPIMISNIRAGRREPGLRPQHLQAVLAASKISDGTVRGAKIGSTQIEYVPGNRSGPFRETIDVGTAGSVGLIAQTIIPISIFKKVDLDIQLVGGTEVPNSPTIDYLERLVLPVCEKLGASMQIMTKRRGYYPKGGGVVLLKCSNKQNVRPLVFEAPSREDENLVTILSVSRGLPEHVSRRQSEASKIILSARGFANIATLFDFSGESTSPGTSLLVYSNQDSKLIGASSLGEKGKKAETVGEEAALDFLREGANIPNVDSHLADMLVTLLCNVEGKSTFTTSALTDHFKTNAEVAKKLTGCKIEFRKEGTLSRVEITGSSEKAN
jgi:RNA 3'-terminal phosphate cyclase (ATP)